MIEPSLNLQLHGIASCSTMRGAAAASGAARCAVERSDDDCLIFMHGWGLP